MSMGECLLNPKKIRFIKNHACLKLSDKLTARASISTGFRAPTLHQIYTQKAQYSFVPGQGIQVGGLINNVSTQAKLLGIEDLDARIRKHVRHCIVKIICSVIFK